MIEFTWLNFGADGPLLALGYGLFAGLLALGFLSLFWQSRTLAARRKHLAALKAQMDAQKPPASQAHKADKQPTP